MKVDITFYLNNFHGLQCFMFGFGKMNFQFLQQGTTHTLYWPPPLTLSEFKPISPYFQSYHLIYIILTIWQFKSLKHHFDNTATCNVIWIFKADEFDCESLLHRGLPLLCLITPVQTSICLSLPKNLCELFAFPETTFPYWALLWEWKHLSH